MSSHADTIRRMRAWADRGSTLVCENGIYIEPEDAYALLAAACSSR